MARPRKTSVKSNLKRCPLLKITKTITTKSIDGDTLEEVVEESFNDCYQTFCMAWDDKEKCCTYFTRYETENADNEDD